MYIEKLEYLQYEFQEDLHTEEELDLLYEGKLMSYLFETQSSLAEIKKKLEIVAWADQINDFGLYPLAHGPEEWMLMEELNFQSQIEKDEKLMLFTDLGL